MSRIPPRAATTDAGPAGWWRRAVVLLLLVIGIVCVHGHVRAPADVARLAAAAVETVADPAGPALGAEPATPEQAFDLEILDRTRATPVPRIVAAAVAGDVGFRSRPAQPLERPPRIDRARA